LNVKSSGVPPKMNENATGRPGNFPTEKPKTNVDQNRGFSHHVSELARRSGVGRVYLSTLESGKPKTITLPMAKKIAKGLNVRPEIFLSSEDSEPIFMSEIIFEAILKEIKRQYQIGGNKAE